MFFDAGFLDPESADSDGLVGVGGDLRPARLLEAYARGIFPFYDDTTPILWWSPDPRAIFEMGSLYISRRLARTVRSDRFRVSIDEAFVEVMEGCSRRDGAGDGVWITPAMIAAYTELFNLGYAHSVEVWDRGELAGGLYGVTIGGFFAGESMFSRVRDASKVALVHVTQRLRAGGFQLFDVQFLNDHTRSMGATEISRNEYLCRLRTALRTHASFA
jgi:leucyl/phenylalanyl-tRNA--protein transferase